jgi:hypothetical protein
MSGVGAGEWKVFNARRTHVIRLRLDWAVCEMSLRSRSAAMKLFEMADSVKDSNNVGRKIPAKAGGIPPSLRATIAAGAFSLKAAEGASLFRPTILGLFVDQRADAAFGEEFEEQGMRDAAV